MEKAVKKISCDSKIVTFKIFKGKFCKKEKFRESIMDLFFVLEKQKGLPKIGKK